MSRFGKLKIDGLEHEDILQNILVKIYSGCGALKDERAIKSWLYMIVRNEIFDTIRLKKRRPLVLLDDVVLEDNLENQQSHKINEYMQLFADKSPTVDDQLDAKDRYKAVMKILKKVNPERVAAIVATQIDGLSYDEVAQLTNVKIGTVKSRIARGRNQIRDELNRIYGETD